jgi:nitrogen-specific signal transduction histidine kinase
MISDQLTPTALIAALTWLEADFATKQITSELESAACRISDLVLAMKQYSFMDRTQFDLQIGLDSTLKIFGHRTRNGIEARREYDPSIPNIPAFAVELNQVWTIGSAMRWTPWVSTACWPC